jgi:hypothetical protein
LDLVQASEKYGGIVNGMTKFNVNNRSKIDKLRAVWKWKHKSTVRINNTDLYTIPDNATLASGYPRIRGIEKAEGGTNLGAEISNLCGTMRLHLAKLTVLECLNINARMASTSNINSRINTRRRTCIGRLL